MEAFEQEVGDCSDDGAQYGQGYGVHDRAGAEQDEDHSGFAVAFAQPAPQADQDGHGAEDADDPAGVDGGDD